MTRQHCRLCGQLGPDLPFADGAAEFCSQSCRYRFEAEPGEEEIPCPGDQVCPECGGWAWAGDPVVEVDGRPDVYVHAHHRRATVRKDVGESSNVEQEAPEPGEQGVAA